MRPRTSADRRKPQAGGGAVDTTQDEIDDGQDSEVVDLARSIVDGRTAEISTMNDLLASL